MQMRFKTPTRRRIPMPFRAGFFKYPIHNKLAYFFIACTDWLLQRCLAKKKLPIKIPKRILICNTAHLGDVILTTALLPVLRQALPHAHIAMLVGSWCQPLVEKHPLLDHFHVIDHWKTSRRKENRIIKIVRYLKMRGRVCKEIRNYDLAIDCGLHFPNMAPLLWSAGIPTRIGFASAGLGPLLTHARPWNPFDNRSVVESFASLLYFLPIHIDHTLLHPTIPISLPNPKSYIVVHMGSGNAHKNWPEANWKALAKRLAEEGRHLLFTGIGKEENQAIERVIAHFPQAENLCGKLSWQQFTTTIQNAALLIATETSAGHIASAVGTPAVLLYTGIHPSNVWRPLGNEQHILTHPTPCSPCLKGCKAMSCIREISVDTLYAAIQSHQKVC